MTALNELAIGMRKSLEWSRQRGQPQAQNARTLARGLQIVLSYEDDLWRLAIRHEDIQPSELEIEIIMIGFGVPESAARANRTTRETILATNRVATYHVVELTWREYERRTSPTAYEAG